MIIHSTLTVILYNFLNYPLGFAIIIKTFNYLKKIDSDYPNHCFFVMIFC